MTGTGTMGGSGDPGFSFSSSLSSSESESCPFERVRFLKDDVALYGDGAEFALFIPRRAVTEFGRGARLLSLGGGRLSIGFGS